MDADVKATPDAAAANQHLTDSIAALLEFHDAHRRGASTLQRAIDRLTRLIGTPAALVAITLGGGLWAGLIIAFHPHGGRRGPFDILELVATCVALLVAVLILVTQRREDLLAERRGQLILELAIVADRKAAKIIALLEEMRRDAPNLANRIDPESADMATPTDVLEVIAAIELGAVPAAD